MNSDWTGLFSENIREFSGYSIGKIFKYLNDPEIISLAGGLPSPDMFQTLEMRTSADDLLGTNARNIMQYTGVPGEPDLIQAVLDFLRRDGINLDKENVFITSSGQHGLDLTGRLFINPGDVILLDRPTFAGAIVAFQMQRPEIIGFDLQEDGYQRAPTAAVQAFLAPVPTVPRCRPTAEVSIGAPRP